MIGSPPWVSAQPSSSANPPSPSAPSPSVVHVDGAPLRVERSGLERRRAGEPVAVFESGGSMPLETWDPIVSEVATFAPYVRYDRSGTGESAWDGVAPTPEIVATRLRSLLLEIGAEPPWVLVGHSWGGALVRYFAGAYPEDVAAVLYLDPTDVTQSPADELAVFRSIGAGEAGRDAFHRFMEQAMATVEGAMRAESDVVLEIMRREPAARGFPAPSAPASVIVAGRIAAVPAAAVPFDSEAYARAAHADRVGRLRSWVSGEGIGTFVVAEDAGHFVHVEAPMLVVSVLRDLVEAGR